jgi:hypothetical protein
MTRHTQRRIHGSTPWGYSKRISFDAGLTQLFDRLVFRTSPNFEDASLGSMQKAPAFSAGALPE